MARKYRNKIGAKWKAGRDAAVIRNPYDGKTVAQVALATQDDIETALEQADECFDEVRRMPGHERAGVCFNIAAIINRRADELVDLITAEAGKPIQYSRGEVARAIQTFLLSAEEAKRIGGEVVPLDIQERTEGYLGLTGRFPRGPMSAITPFNFPLNLVAHKLGPAIATGTPVVLKPARQSPLSGLVLAEIVEEAGWPGAALSVIYCEDEQAETLVVDERTPTFSFTGSDRVGWMLKEKIPRKKVILECGGDAAAVVAEDADLDWAISRCVIGSFAYAGQVCIGIQRLLVHRSRYDEFMERFLDQVSKIGVGDPKHPDTVVGPVIEESAADRIEKWVAEATEKGASRLCGGRREANLLWPTVLTGVPDDAALADNEAFGPVVMVAPFEEFDEALALVNDSRYGLQAGIFTTDLRRAFHAYRELVVGGVVINDYPMLRVDNCPYGGVKDSGVGREGVRSSIEELTEVRTMVVRTI